MIYRFDKNLLSYKKVKIRTLLILVSSTIIIPGIITLLQIQQTVKAEEETIKMIILRQNSFTEEKFINKLNQMNFKFPHIVYAQAILESDSFRSRIFVENNNLFGMKKAIQRVSLAKDIQYEHAVYDSWIESLYDYAFYYSTYLSKINTEEDYFDYLSQWYAEDPDYVKKLKKIINENDIFNN